MVATFWGRSKPARSVGSKLVESNPLAGYLKGVISRASRTCFSFFANRATSSNFLLTGKTLPARALPRAKSSSMYTGKLYVLDKCRRDSQPLKRTSAISTTLLRISHPFVRPVVRFFPRTEKDTWYNRGFYFLFWAA